MLDFQDAKYIFAQLKFIDFYKKQMEFYDSKIKEYDEQIYNLTSPKSPNSGVVVGVYPNDIRVKVSGSGNNVDHVKARLRDEQTICEKELRYFAKLYYKAIFYRDKLIGCDEGKMFADYLNNDSYSQLQSKYNVSNIYDHMLRVIRREIKSL